MRVVTGASGPVSGTQDLPYSRRHLREASGLVGKATRIAPYLSKKLRAAAAQSGATVVIGGDTCRTAHPGVRIKTIDRILEKGLFKYNGGFEQVWDAAAGTHKFATLSALREGAMASIEHQFGAENIVKVEDDFGAPRESGYADAAINIRMPNGLIVEAQLHVAPMYFAKQVEQVLYSERRKIVAGVIPDQNYRLAWLEGAAAAIYGVAQEAVRRERQLSESERDFILSFLDGAR